MKIWVIRRGDILIPENPSDSEKIQKLPEGKPVEVTVRVPRSLPMSRFYWAVLDAVIEHMPDVNPHGVPNLFGTSKDLNEAIKLTCGYAKRVLNFDGTVMMVPRSISFDKEKGMDQIEFAEFFEKAMQAISEHVLGYDVDKIIHEVLRGGRYPFDLDVAGVKVRIEPRGRYRWRVTKKLKGICDLAGIIGDDFSDVVSIAKAIEARCAKENRQEGG